MGKDEQVEEREVLDSIFPEEITDISNASYRISIALDFAQEDEDADPRKVLHRIVASPVLLAHTIFSNTPPHSHLPRKLSRHRTPTRHFPPTKCAPHTPYLTRRRQV